MSLDLTSYEMTFLKGVLFGIWFVWLERARRRRARRIAEGRPSAAERFGWWIASLLAPIQRENDPRRR